MRVRIGEYLTRNGILTEAQVDTVLNAQKEGDTRLFGEIAVALGMMEDSSLKRFLDFVSQHDGIEGADGTTKSSNPVTTYDSTNQQNYDKMNGMTWFG